MHGFKDVGSIQSVTESRKIRQAESNMLPQFFFQTWSHNIEH